MQRSQQKSSKSRSANAYDARSTTLVAGLGVLAVPSRDWPSRPGAEYVQRQANLLLSLASRQQGGIHIVEGRYIDRSPSLAGVTLTRMGIRS